MAGSYEEKFPGMPCPGEPGFFQAIQSRIDRDRERRRARGPFPPSHKVGDTITIGPFRGEVLSVRMLELCPCYRVEFTLPVSGNNTMIVDGVVEEDPGKLVIDNPNDIAALMDRVEDEHGVGNWPQPPQGKAN